MPGDAIYSTLYINVSRGLRPTRRRNYSCAYRGKQEAETPSLRLSEHTSGKNLFPSAPSRFDYSELKTSDRINARAFPSFSFYIWYLKFSCLILILANTN